MPSLIDPYFSQAVVYIYEHDEAGAVGFVINKPMNMTVGEILAYAKIPCNEYKQKEQPILLGGPVKQEQLFLIFYDQSQEPAGGSLHLPHSKELLHSVGLAPDDKLMAFLGHSVWRSGQLEDELKENTWLIASADYDLLYNVPFNQRYGTAASLMGFNFNQLSAQVGHA